ncbi:MAG: hypothetical protein GXP27_04150 [Planctomycetes bacterium]|nr:hypothetical protein [Planctomycetota bacterium]
MPHLDVDDVGVVSTAIPDSTTSPSRVRDPVATLKQILTLLTESQKWIRKFRGKYIVVKLGGSTLCDDAAVGNVLSDVALIRVLGGKVVLVHGGSKDLSQKMREEGHEPRFVEGRRYTDEKTLRIAKEVLGTISKTLATKLTELCSELPEHIVSQGRSLSRLLKGCSCEALQQLIYDHLGKLTAELPKLCEELRASGLEKTCHSLRQVFDSLKTVEKPNQLNQSVSVEFLVRQVDKIGAAFARDVSERRHVGVPLLPSRDRLFLRTERMMFTTADGRQTDLGFVGRVVGVDETTMKEVFLRGGLPVIPSLGYTTLPRRNVRRRYQLLNVNADTAAANIAALLHAEKLVFVTDVPGILEDRHAPESLYTHITASACRELVRRKVIASGMVPKVDAALEALNSGVPKVHIVDCRSRHCLLLEIYSNGGAGTEIVKDEEGAD